MNKPIIFAVVGESGTGKTTLVQSLEHRTGIKMIESHTDRPPRFEGEAGHVFWSKEEFDQFNKEDMIAYTKFGNRRYCCLKTDVESINTYVIDEPGLDYLISQHKNDYNIYSIRLLRSVEERIGDGTSVERINRDKDKFVKPLGFYDLVINNSGSITDAYDSFESFVSSTLDLSQIKLNVDV